MKIELATVLTESNMFGAIKGRTAEVIKRYFYNGEVWLKLKDLNTGKIFKSPSIFWDTEETNLK